MYAVIRSGGKQYRVAPGDVIRVEKLAPAVGKHEGNSNDIEFPEVLAVSRGEGQIGRPQGEARVLGRVLGEGRADKILVFHFKRKKQYKRLRGHRQPFTAVRITEISLDGEKFTAPDLPARETKTATTKTAAETELAASEASKKKTAPKVKAQAGATTGAGKKTAATRHGGGSKLSGTKSKGGTPPPPKKPKK